MNNIEGLRNSLVHLVRVRDNLWDKVIDLESDYRTNMEKINYYRGRLDDVDARIDEITKALKEESEEELWT